MLNLRPQLHRVFLKKKKKRRRQTPSFSKVGPPSTTPSSPELSAHRLALPMFQDPSLLLVARVLYSQNEGLSKQKEEKHSEIV